MHFMAGCCSRRGDGPGRTPDKTGVTALIFGEVRDLKDDLQARKGRDQQCEKNIPILAASRAGHGRSRLEKRWPSIRTRAAAVCVVGSVSHRYCLVISGVEFTMFPSPSATKK